jgi:hypothetical protein
MASECMAYGLAPGQALGRAYFQVCYRFHFLAAIVHRSRPVVCLIDLASLYPAASLYNRTLDFWSSLDVLTTRSNLVAYNQVCALTLIRIRCE